MKVRGPVRIEALAAGGRGLCRIDGQVWFIPGTVPGDIVLVRLERDRGRHVEGRLVRIAEPSPDRRSSPCALQDRCGGCPLMPLGEERQAEWRRRFVVDALERIGGIDSPPVEPLEPAREALGYRNRVEFLLVPGEEGDPSALGLHARDDPRAIVDVDRCLLQDEAANALLRSIRAHLGRVHARSGTAPALSGARIVIRRSEATRELLLGFRDAGGYDTLLRDLARVLERDHPELVGVARIRTGGARRGDARVEVVRGRGWIEERIGGLVYRIPAATFLQISARAATLLVDLVADLARPGAAAVLDLYCGVGAHAHALVGRGIAGAALGVDADRDAVDCASEVARRVGLRARFERSDVGRYLARPRHAPDLVVANPPRTGMGREVAAALRTLGPPRIVVVSCEAATLARDLRVLVEGRRYRLDRVIPLDLFPQTAHVETVSLLVRE